MSLIHNAQTKLLANALDRASTALVTVGVVTPVAGYLYGVARPSVLFLAAAGYIWFFAAVSLHLAARRLLGRLK